MEEMERSSEGKLSGESLRAKTCGDALLLLLGRTTEAAAQKGVYRFSARGYQKGIHATASSQTIFLLGSLQTRADAKQYRHPDARGSHQHE